MTPSLAKKKNLFFESYTDSPEFTYIDNPVVYMDEELLPEEQGLSSVKLPSIPSPRGGLRRARHPLSQVSFPESSLSPQDKRRIVPARGSKCERTSSDIKCSASAATRPTASKEADKFVFVDDEENEEACEDGEEPEDDTFEFLLR